MLYCWVISVIILVVLDLPLSSRTAPPAYAGQPQGTENTGVTQGVDERDSEAVPQVQPRPDNPVVSITRPPESTIRSGSQRATEAALTRVAAKLALDLGLIHEPEEDAGRVLDRVGISPKGGWSRNTELTPEIFYDVLAAARRAANAGRLSVSADGAEAIVRAVMIPFFAAPEEGAAEYLPFAAAENQPVVASETPVLLYEQAPVLPYEWQSGFLAGPVVIVPRPVFPPLHRRHHVFVPCPAWRCRHGLAHFGGPVVRPPAFTRTRISPPVRAVPMAPRPFSPPVFGFRGGTGAVHMGGGHFHGGFRR